MGVDLAIYPVRKGEKFTHERIEFDRDSELFGLFLTLFSFDFNNGYGLSCYQEDGYTVTKDDCYGDSLKFITSDEIEKLKPFVRHFYDSSKKNRASIDYLSALSDYELVLYWH